MNFNWSALSNEQKKLFIGVAVLAVLLVGALGWIMLSSPGESAGSVRQEQKELQTQLSEAKDIILRKPLVEKELEESIAHLESMASYAPAVHDRYAWAYEYISRRSALAGVMIDGLQEETVTAAKNSEETPPYEVSISTRCGYNELVRFLWYLEEGNPLVSVKELTVASSPANQERHSVRIVVQWPPSFNIEKAE